MAQIAPGATCRGSAAGVEVQGLDGRRHVARGDPIGSNNVLCARQTAIRRVCYGTAIVRYMPREGSGVSQDAVQQGKARRHAWPHL